MNSPRFFRGRIVLQADAGLDYVVLLADGRIVRRLHESVEAWVDDIGKSGAFLGDRDGSAVNSVIEHACLDVGEFFAEAAPQIAILVVDRIRIVAALVPLSLVRIEPDCIDGFVEEHSEADVVDIGECNVFGLGGAVFTAVPDVRTARSHHFVVLERLARTVVCDELDAVAGGCPARDVSNLLVCKIAHRVDNGPEHSIVILKSGQDSGGAILSDGVGKLKVAIAHTFRMRVGHAAVVVAV